MTWNIDREVYMSTLNIIRYYIDYHISMSRQVWESIDQITEEQFVQEDTYSRGSIRNLMVHIASTDRRWLAGLKNDPFVGHRRSEDYPNQASARALFDDVAKDLTDYVAKLSEAELEQSPVNIPASRMLVLMHLVNHGTDHRSTVLQKLNEFGAPTFDQDFISWLWKKK
jgi:uncharacterized damage-inducible protein DinB